MSQIQLPEEIEKQLNVLTDLIKRECHCDAILISTIIMRIVTASWASLKQDIIDSEYQVSHKMIDTR